MKIFLNRQFLVQYVFTAILFNIAFSGLAEENKNIPGALKLMTADEVKRIQTVWASGAGEEYQELKSLVKNAEGIVKTPVAFPPRGGQHNQWYQCVKCETALKTLPGMKHQCPVCKKIYAGYPYDDCIYSKEHNGNFRDLRTCAKAYLITGNQKFAEYAKNILLGYAERYDKYPHHDNRSGNKPGTTSRSGAHIYEQTLNEASTAASSIAPAYDMIRNAETLTPVEKQKIKNNLILPLLKNLDRNKAGKNNWQTWHNAAMVSLGVAFELPEWTDKGLNNPGNGFYHQMKVSVTKDGIWYEGSMAYHTYALSALALTAQAAQGAGIDLWKTPQLAKMVEAPALYIMPDGTLPRFADSVNSRPQLPAAIGEPAWAALHDPLIASILPTKISWESIRYGRNPAEFANIPPPVMESALFKDAGHAILRSNGEKKLTAVLSFAPYRGFHSHFDMLSFIFFGFGQEICVDPGRAESQAYRLPVHKFWYKGTVSHNAVLVDFKPQGDSTTSELLFFDANPNCPAAAAKTVNAYPGVDQTRLLAITPDYLLVLDSMKSDKSAIFNWMCHFEAEKLISDSPTRSVNAAGLGQGFEYIKNAGEGNSTTLAKFEFLQKTFKTCLTVSAKGRLNFFTGDGPKGSIAKRCPLVIVSNADKTKSLAFAATLEPVKNATAPTIKSIELSQNGKLLTIKVFRTGGTDAFTYDGKNKFSAKLVK